MIFVEKNGMVSTSEAELSGLPIFDWSKGVDGEPTGRTFDHCTKKELASIGVFLTPYDEFSLIVAFEKMKNYRGLKPLYSVEQIRRIKGF